MSKRKGGVSVVVWLSVVVTDGDGRLRQTVFCRDVVMPAPPTEGLRLQRGVRSEPIPPMVVKRVYYGLESGVYYAHVQRPSPRRLPPDRAVGMLMADGWRELGAKR